MPIFYVLILLLTSFLWGGNFVYSKFLIGHATPMTLTILRWIIAIVVLFPLLIRKEERLIPPKNSILPLFLMGVTGVVLFNIFQFLALARTSSINAGLISTLNPLSIAVSSSIFLKEKISFRQLMALMLSLLGVFIVISKGSLHKIIALHFNFGDLWMILAVILWGVYSVCGKWAMTKVSPMKATFYSGVYGVLLLLPLNIRDFQVIHIDTAFTLYYHGYITELDEEKEGFWARLDDDPTNEDFFHYGDIEVVIDGDKIPFFGGWTKRIK